MAKTIFKIGSSFEAEPVFDQPVLEEERDAANPLDSPQDPLHKGRGPALTEAGDRDGGIAGGQPQGT